MRRDLVLLGDNIGPVVVSLLKDKFKRGIVGGCVCRR